MKDRIRGKNEIKKICNAIAKLQQFKYRQFFFLFLLNHKIIKDKI